MLKWLINGIIVVPMLMYNTYVPFFEAAIAATALTLIAYFVGDQVILRLSNNALATFCDAVLAFVVLWIVSYEMNWGLSFGRILLTTALLGIAEWLIHRYVLQPGMSVQTS